MPSRIRLPDTIHEIAHLTVGVVLDQSVDVCLEPRKALIEIARVLQIADDGAVEALAGYQQGNARGVGGEKDTSDAILQLVDLDTLDFAVGAPSWRRRLPGALQAPCRIGTSR